MTITTNYNVGDKVWTNMFRQDIREVEIDEIRIMVKHPERVWSVEYLLDHYWFNEDEFARTETELIESLKR